MQASQAQLIGAELLAWRRAQLIRGGRAVDLDWLLDLAGGLGWQPLQALRLHPDGPVRLKRSASRSPCNIWWGAAPGGISSWQLPLAC
jgi:hypothetical protein